MERKEAINILKSVENGDIPNTDPTAKEAFHLLLILQSTSEKLYDRVLKARRRW